MSHGIRSIVGSAQCWDELEMALEEEQIAVKSVPDLGLTLYRFVHSPLGAQRYAGQTGDTFTTFGRQEACIHAIGILFGIRIAKSRHTDPSPDGDDS